MRAATSFLKKLWEFNRVEWILGIFVVSVGTIFILTKTNTTASYQLISVTENPITETVSITGNTTAAQSVNLGFNNNGTIANIYSSVGEHVNQGALLADLDMSDLKQQLKQAQASVDIEMAKLSSLKAGAAPEDIAISKLGVDKANQDLVNLYAGVKDTLVDGYAKANDAMHTQLGPLFTNTYKNPQLTFITPDSQASIAITGYALKAIVALSDWQKELANIDVTSDKKDSLLQSNLAHLVVVNNLLTSIAVLISSDSTNLDAATLATDRANVSAGITEVNLASQNINTLSQNIVTQKLAVAQAQAALAFKKAGATTQDIAVQDANVKSAQANVTSVQIKFVNSQIIAPISGVITQFDAKIGQIATQGSTLISIISSGAFRVDANVPEIDISKIIVGDPVSMTFNAFPGETFFGNVFYIDPAETINNKGEINFKIKTSFTKADLRMKSGLTANINIQTKHKDKVLMLPERAILQTTDGNFVKTFSGKTVVQVPVTLGIKDQDGNVEIVSGVTKGESVINIGAR